MYTIYNYCLSKYHRLVNKASQLTATRLAHHVLQVGFHYLSSQNVKISSLPFQGFRPSGRKCQAHASGLLVIRQDGSDE